MRTTYLGLELRSPIVAASSPFTADARRIVQCARHGAGAVVLRSVFEEQIVRQAESLASPYIGRGDAGEYLERYLGDQYLTQHLQLIDAARETDIPVIASINCIAGSERWVDYASALERAGASALEVNIFLQPTDRHLTAAALEQSYTETVGAVTDTVAIPVAVKLSPRFTNLLAVADGLLAHGARGAVLFNRFFEPDIDIDRMQFRLSPPYSEPSELRGVLRSVALCASAVPQLDLAVSTGVHDGEAAVKALLCGARAVQLCTAIQRYGYEIIGTVDAFIDRWAERQGFESLEEFRGRMDYGHAGGAAWQRTQYLRYYRTLAEPVVG